MKLFPLGWADTSVGGFNFVRAAKNITKYIGFYTQ